MDPKLYQRACEVFSRVCAAPAGERAAAIDRLCANDDALRRVVHELLAHDTSRIPERIPIAPLPGLFEFQPGDHVGRHYTIERVLGAGGMATVYLATQTEPVSRRVALKVIRPGLDTRSFLMRFERERYLLALMDHPCIAKVFDAGATDAGRPFFVMEYVDGEPITNYCDDHRLEIRARLALFVQVCGAIQHAHQKFVIHRDIKPSNVLVSEIDGVPTPRVIDFGIAKAMEETNTGFTVETQHGAALGTPEYMSPEQANARDVDTRTDVYSLGVLLYELLCACRPVEAGARHEESVPRPSTRVRGLGARATDAASARTTDPARLERDLRTDLDWIALRALEYDRARRYASASELAADVERYLAGDPVVARPPTIAYRARKYVRRHRVLVTATVAVAVTLIAGLITTTWQARQARERSRELEAIATRLVNQFHEFSDMPGVISTKRAVTELAANTLANISARRALDRDTRRQVASAYEALAQLRGDNYVASLGDGPGAREAATKALVLREQLHIEDPASYVLETEFLKVQVLRTAIDPLTPDALAAMEHAESTASLAPDSTQYYARQCELAIADGFRAEHEYTMGRPDPMMALLNHQMMHCRLLANAPPNLLHRALLADALGRYSYVAAPATADSLAQQCLALCQENLREHPFSWKAMLDVSFAHRGVAYVAWRMDDTQQALQHMRGVAEVRRRMAAADPLDMRSQALYVTAQIYVGMALTRCGRADSALVWLTRCNARAESLADSDHAPGWLFAEMCDGYASLARAYADLGEFAQADDYYRRAMTRYLGFGGTPIELLRVHRGYEEYADFLDQRGERAQSAQWHRRSGQVVRAMVRRLVDVQGSPTAFADAVAGLCHVATYEAPYQPALADSLWDLALHTAQEQLGNDHPLTTRVLALRDGAVWNRAPGTPYPRDAYVDGPQRLVRYNPMWGRSPWPPAATSRH